MIEYHLDTEHSILHVQPKSAIENDDFVKLVKAVDPHIEETGRLSGSSSKAQGSRDGGALGQWSTSSLRSRSSQAHKENRSRNGLPHGDVAEHLTSHFVSAEITHFTAGRIGAARQWVMSGS